MTQNITVIIVWKLKGGFILHFGLKCSVYKKCILKTSEHSEHCAHELEQHVASSGFRWGLVGLSSADSAGTSCKRTSKLHT